MAALAAAGLAAIVLVVVALSGARTAPVEASPETVPTIEAPAPALPVVAFVGDSYTAGSGMDSGDAVRWPFLVADDLGVAAQNLGSGGAGYVTPSVTGATIVTQAAKVDPDSAGIVFFGSRNDSAGYDAVNAAAGEAIAKARGAAPNAKILIVGPPWPTADVPDAVLESRDALRDVAAAQQITFIDPIAEGWFVGDPSLIGIDGVHPTGAGHQYLRSLMQPLVSALLS